MTMPKPKKEIKDDFSIEQVKRVAFELGIDLSTKEFCAEDLRQGMLVE